IQISKHKEIAKFGAALIPLGLNFRVGAFSRPLNHIPTTMDVTYIPGVPGYGMRTDGKVRGGGVSLPISVLGILTLGGFTAAENFMTYSGPSHSVKIIDTGFRIAFPN